jgi:bisphosphoglycerate-dependent phosphoglycerate mutase
MLIKNGAVSDADVERGEAAEKQLDAFIAHRSRREPERPAEAAWKESERRYNSTLQAARREAWATYHRQQAARHRRTLAALIDEHEQLAESLQVPQPKHSEATKGHKHD